MFAHIVLFEQVVRIRHCLELQIVATWVFKEHRPLLAWLSLKPQVWFNNELDLTF